VATQAAPLPYQGTMAGFRRFSVAEYHRLIQLGILTEDDNLELLEGYLVHKMSRNPPHDAAIQKGNKKWLRLLPAGWDLRVQSAVTLSDSEPEPDFAIVRGDEAAYATRHPTAADVGLVVEVSDSTLPGDRDDKGRIYARRNRLLLDREYQRSPDRGVHVAVRTGPGPQVRATRRLSGGR
jgi:Uma2 family endonuclease